jgi:hypothetical protein
VGSSDDDDVEEDEQLAEREILLCHGDDAWAQAWMARENGRSTGWLGVQGAHTLSLG